jgi:hypothetical protein
MAVSYQTLRVFGGWNVCMFLTLEQVRKAMRENNIAAL